MLQGSGSNCWLKTKGYRHGLCLLQPATGLALHKGLMPLSKTRLMAPCFTCLRAPPGAVKYIYFCGFVLSAVVSWLLRDYGQYLVSRAGNLAKCLDSGAQARRVPSCGHGVICSYRPALTSFLTTRAPSVYTQTCNCVQAVCVGKGAVLRISFGNFLFFGVHALALAGVHQVRCGSFVLWHTRCAQVALKAVCTSSWTTICLTATFQAFRWVELELGHRHQRLLCKLSAASSRDKSRGRRMIRACCCTLACCPCSYARGQP